MSKGEIREFIASSEIFSDFTVEISFYNVQKLDEKKFHIHGKTIEMILISRDTESFFICDHE